MSNLARRKPQAGNLSSRALALAFAGIAAVSALSACDPGDPATGTTETSTDELDDDSGLDGMQLNPGTGDIGFYDGTGMPL